MMDLYTIVMHVTAKERIKAEHVMAGACVTIESPDEDAPASTLILSLDVEPAVHLAMGIAAALLNHLTGEEKAPILAAFRMIGEKFGLDPTTRKVTP